MMDFRNISSAIVLAISLTSSPAFAATVDGAPNLNMATDSGLYVWRTSGGDWQVRYLAGGSSAQRFAGVFTTATTIASYGPIALEAADKAFVGPAKALNVDMHVAGKDVDGVKLRAAWNGSLCLSTSGSARTVYLGKNATRATTPVALNGQNACASVAGAANSRKFNAGHYIALMRGNDSQSVMSASITAGVKGFMKRYTWRSLEPAKGSYDFSEIASDLSYLASQGMHLVVMIEDKTFVDERPTPQYLWGDTKRNNPGGWTAVRWAPFVVTRAKALAAALGKRFDSNPYFEGVATQETAPGFSNATLNATNYTPEKYRDALIGYLKSATSSMPNSRVFWFMNFLPRNQSYLADIASAVSKTGVIMGGPDVMPDNAALQQHTYPLYTQFAGKMPLFGQIEPICYAHEHANKNYPTKYWTMKELFVYGRDKLNIDYMFWVRFPKSQYYNSYDYFDALPVISQHIDFNQ